MRKFAFASKKEEKSFKVSFKGPKMAPVNGGAPPPDSGASGGGGGGGGSGPPSRTPSIMDSPTLARVERARLRQEAAANGGGGSQPHLREDSLERVLLDPKIALIIKSRIIICLLREEHIT